MAGQQDECFVVGAIGKPSSEQRIHADWFFEGIIRPLFTEHYPNFRVLRADHMKTPGIITSQIIEKLLNARLVIADLTFLNPNAFYEIGIRHMTGKPVVHVHSAGEAIPFDISTFLSLEYSIQQHSEMVAARDNLKTLVDNVLVPDHKMENPVTQARGRAQFEATATPPDRLLQAQIDAINLRLGAMERPGNFRTNVVTFKRDNTTGRLYGGSEVLPAQELTFSLRPETNPRVLADFIENHLTKYASNSVVIRSAKSGESCTVYYDSGALTGDQVNGWHHECDRLGIDLIPF